MLFERLGNAAETWGEEYEVIFVNDGSSDNTSLIISDLYRRDPRWKALSFSRNFGHQTAVSAGIHHAKGDAVVVLDADMQDPPEVVDRLLEKWREGYQVVFAVRRKRKEGVFKRMAYFVFYRTLRRVASIDIPLDAGDFCVMDRSVVDVLKTMPERDRFVRGLRSWAGFSQIGVEYERAQRHAGKTKYSFSKLLRLASDGVFSFSVIPLKLSSILGMVLCIGSMLLAALLVVWRITDASFLGMHPTEATGWTSLLCVILFLSGLQFLTMGILAEYVSRIFTEVKGRPQWVISHSLGIDSVVLESEPTQHKVIEEPA